MERKNVAEQIISEEELRHEVNIREIYNKLNINTSDMQHLKT